MITINNPNNETAALNDDENFLNSSGFFTSSLPVDDDDLDDDDDIDDDDDLDDVDDLDIDEVEETTADPVIEDADLDDDLTLDDDDEDEDDL